MSDPEALYAAIDGTWPAARRFAVGPWVLRDGGGGGKRVSAATLTRPHGPDDIERAADQMRAMDQAPLFMITDGQDDLDADLAERGYEIADPVVLYTLPVAALVDTPVPPVTAFAIWEPLEIMKEIWATGGIGPARLAIMDRAPVKTALFGRANAKPAGVGFAAVHDGIAMVHAVEVLPTQRRQGVAQWIMRRAAFWAAEHGAHTVSVLCVRDNHAANALYQGLGFAPVCGYHYRMHPEAT